MVLIHRCTHIFHKNYKKEACRKEGSNLIIILFLEKLRPPKGYFRKTLLVSCCKGAGQHAPTGCARIRKAGESRMPSDRSTNLGKKCSARISGFRDHGLKQSGLGVE